MLLSYQKSGISEKKEVKKSFENYIGGAPVFVSHQKKKKSLKNCFVRVTCKKLGLSPNPPTYLGK